MRVLHVHYKVVVHVGTVYGFRDILTRSHLEISILRYQRPISS